MPFNGDGQPRWQALWQKWSRVEQDLEPYRRLALQLHYRLSAADRPRSVLVTTPGVSSLPAHGSALLARSVAETLHKRVLLIDATPGAGDVSALLEGNGRPGFADLLSDPDLGLADVVVATSHETVGFLPAGGQLAARTATAERLCGLLEAAQRDNELVIVAGGSVLQSPLPLALAPHVGCVLLLAIENDTRLEDLDAAQQALSLGQAREVGLVLTSPFVSKRWSI